MIKLHAALASLVLACGPAVQAAEEIDDNSHLWLNYVGTHPLGDGPWGLHLESQVRRADFGEDWQQLLLRTGLIHNFSPNLSATLGYAFVKTYPYGDFPALDDFPEHRIWEQLSYTHKLFELEWQHRFRLEQRFIGELSPLAGGGYDVADYRYENRVRYMLRTTLPLTSDKKTYIALWDEVFFNFGGNVKGNHFDQNRAFIGIGHKLTDSTRVELGFLEQTLQKRGGKVWEHNHTVALWLTSRWPFGN